MINYYSFRIVIHDNGELRLNLSGYRGAEYYASKDDLFIRLMEFKQFNCDIYLTLLFTKNDNKKGFYMPSKEISECWIGKFNALESLSIDVDLANVKTRDGEFVVPSFYAMRDSGMIGFQPAGKSTIEKEVPYQLSRGFDITKNKSLYKDGL